MLTEERHQRIFSPFRRKRISWKSANWSINYKHLSPLSVAIYKNLKHREFWSESMEVPKDPAPWIWTQYERKNAKVPSRETKIAQYAVSLIKRMRVIYLDAGTITLEMIPFLSSISNVKVVTNSVKHAALLIDQGIETLILGGTIKISTNAVLGSGASEQLRKLRFNRCFIGMNGAHVGAGFTTPDPEEAMIKKIAIENSQKLMYYWTILNFNKLLLLKLLPLKTQRLSQTFCPKNYAAKFRTQTTIMEVSEWFILSHSTHQLTILSTSKHYNWANLIEWSKTLNFLAAKGINVSRILQRIQIPSTALGFIGGFTGRFIEDWLINERITTDFHTSCCRYKDQY